MKIKPSVFFLLSLISGINTQNVTTTTSPINTSVPTATYSPSKPTESYPEEGSTPISKPEWLQELKQYNISNAPISKNSGSNDGSDEYCNWPQTGCMGTSIYQCPKGYWGLTFDDGPSDLSPILYDFLKSTNQKATLFMIGANVIKYPDLVKRAFDEGHEIAIHTWTHTSMLTLSNERLVAELKWTELAIKEITGQSPRLYRPPYGDIDNRVRDVGNALGFISVLWSHDTNDWMISESKGFQSEWIDSNFSSWIEEASRSSSGGISLEHDIEKPSIDAAIRNLPALQKAYKVVTVGECASIASYKESDVVPVTNITVSSSSSQSSTVSETLTAIPDATQTNQPTLTSQNISMAVHTTSNLFVLSVVLISALYLL